MSGPIDPAAVARALDIATLENGYSFEGWPDIDIAHDLCAYDDDYAMTEAADLVPAIAAWRAARAAPS